MMYRDTWSMKDNHHEKSQHSKQTSDRPPGSPRSRGDRRVARFNLAWLLEGELTGDGEVPELE